MIIKRISTKVLTIFLALGTPLLAQYRPNPERETRHSYHEDLERELPRGSQPIFIDRRDGISTYYNPVGRYYYYLFESDKKPHKRNRRRFIDRRDGIATYYNSVGGYYYYEFE